ncbi:hypothetical protein EDB83DRAFT_2364430 [Lactarius deliciosus]|nr:hypothetical protein EDB83DRAFT_2364430 [Lactarius deliciosus]
MRSGLVIITRNLRDSISYSRRTYPSFLFFSSLVEFLSQSTRRSFATLGYIGMFALPYAVLTILPNFYLNCPYGTPLSGITSGLSQILLVLPSGVKRSTIRLRCITDGFVIAHELVCNNSPPKRRDWGLCRKRTRISDPRAVPDATSE